MCLTTRVSVDWTRDSGYGDLTVYQVYILYNMCCVMSVVTFMLYLVYRRWSTVYKMHRL